MKSDEWTDDEVEKLKELYNDPKKTIEEINEELPNRTINAIRLKASREGITRGVWEDPAGIRELMWNVHKPGNRMAIIHESLRFNEAVKILMESDDLEMTGYRGRKIELSIKRIPPR